MKKILMASLGSLIALTFLMTAACSKNDSTTPTKVLTKPEILARKPWQVTEVWRNDAGVNTHYIRGGTNNTGTAYDNIHITFNADGTGSYTDENGIVHSATWQFSTSDMRNMTFSISNPGATTFTWNLVEITDGSFVSTTPIGSNFLLSSRYTQVNN